MSTTIPSYVLGFQAKLFRGTAGTTAATEMKNVKDLTPNMETNQIDVTTRATDGWRMWASGLKDASLELQAQYDPNDADWLFLHNAFMSNTPIALFVSDGLGNGIDCDWIVTAESDPQPLEEAIVSNYTLKPTSKAGRGVTIVGYGASSN